MKPEEFSDRLWEFAARVGKVVEALPETKLGRHVAGQLVRCGTASAPNYDEARSAESRDDFVHKLGIATKEMRESYGWLRFAIRSALLPAAKVAAIADEAEQLLKMLTRSVHTAKPRRDLTDQSKISTQPSAINHQQSPVSHLGTHQSIISNQQPAISNQQSPASHLRRYQGLDHLAIAVPDTEAALYIWRDTFGFPVLYSEDVNGGTVRLTHLDLGNTQLQLVQPLAPDHPLQAWLAKKGPGLHHFCLKVEDVDEAMKDSPVPTAPQPHQGTQGKRAVFLDKTATQGVQVEWTGK
jgi:methylmalonyl-CoA/ethylmalonyl-CoA epimerase